jgi:hypothetical protein
MFYAVKNRKPVQQKQLYIFTIKNEHNFHIH